MLLNSTDCCDSRTTFADLILEYSLDDNCTLVRGNCTNFDYSIHVEELYVDLTPFTTTLGVNRSLVQGVESI